MPQNVVPSINEPYIEDENSVQFFSLREFVSIPQVKQPEDVVFDLDSNNTPPAEDLKSVVKSQNQGSVKRNAEGECERTLDDDAASKRKRWHRIDSFGQNIVRGGKKHRVIFADHKQINKPLFQVHEVESYKQYNSDMSQRGDNKNCCLIF